MKILWKYLGSLIKSGTGNSSKAFGLVLSALVGGFAGLCVCLVLLWDVIQDGQVGTDLEGLGWFLMCDGVFMFGGGLNKTLSETIGEKESMDRHHRRKHEREREEDPDDYYPLQDE